ncbi:DUF1488 family protein [Caballeronia ptereochthonis]|uniref:Uncharacterized protein n=1 Tax=Caballeronia ptereochthonis TaxID=1777144 RepID=A0A158AXV1_9BURK|nr:DUF1488 family protein [Caballeronia ptereochthonis]SAK62684.1 hypothetical protein AWB83_02532 [Caballeronia ptereochthonis]
MADTIEGIRIVHIDGHDAVKFGIKVDSVHYFCVMTEKVLHELSQPGGHKSDLLREFELHRELIYEKAAAAIRGGLRGEPLLLHGEVFTS